MQTRKFFVAGRWTDSGERVAIRSPYDGCEVARVTQATPVEVEEALAAALAARERLQEASTGSRRDLLMAISAGIRRRAAELAQVICQEAGKPIRLAEAEVNRAAETFALTAAEWVAFEGRTVAVDLDAGSQGVECEVRRFPAGVVVGIVPFNFPLNLGAHKVAPALAVGAPIIVKPPPQAPSAQLLLAEIVAEAGVAGAALQVLPCSNEVAERLATDERVRVLSFTGSATVGWSLRAKAKGRVLLELGGNAAAVVCSDADLDWAAERCALSAFQYAGQVCIKLQRILVEEAVYSAFVARFLARVRALGVGDPTKPETVVGPVISDEAAERISLWIEEARSLGAKHLHGGEANGRLLHPTVLEGTSVQAKVVSEEVFGPVVNLARVRSFDEALAEVNAGKWGLQAAVFTNDLRKVRSAFHRLEVGGVVVNDAPNFRSDHYPYGGVKGSGLGREGGRSSLEELTDERVLVTRLGRPG